jgi:hypothetical protein
MNASRQQKLKAIAGLGVAKEVFYLILLCNVDPPDSHRGYGRPAYAPTHRGCGRASSEVVSTQQLLAKPYAQSAIR